MKKVYSLIIILILASACGKNDDNSSKPNSVKEADFSGVTSGLVLTVKNALPEQQIGDWRVKPALNAFFCSPLRIGDNPNLPTKDRCISLPKIISNGTEQTFVISREELAQVYTRGGGVGAFEFADNQQITSDPWPCYSPNNKVALHPNFDVKQSWHVEVNQRFTLSYGCLIDRK